MAAAQVAHGATSGWPSRICVACGAVTLSAPPLFFLQVASHVPALFARGSAGGGDPSALTLAEGSYFDADDARQMRLSWQSMSVCACAARARHGVTDECVG